MPEPVIARVTKTPKIWKCLKCGYEWDGRGEGKPIRCANTDCKRVNWDRPREENCACGRRRIRGRFNKCSLCRRESLKQVTIAAEIRVETEPKIIDSVKPEPHQVPGGWD